MPPAGVGANWLRFAVELGPLFDPDRRIWRGSVTRGQADQDDNDPSRPLAIILSTPDAPKASTTMPSSPKQVESSAVQSLAGTRPVRTIKFYFSEEFVDPNNPRGPVRFYITEEVHTPKVFNPNDPQDVEAHQRAAHVSYSPDAFSAGGAIWRAIRGRDSPRHREHSLLERSPFPSVKLRMDFRDPGIIGIFPFHRHILQHEHGGMMGSIRVEPAVKKTGAANP